MFLSYNGIIIDQFKLMFKDGEIIDFLVEKGEVVLKDLINIDEGLRRLGEVVLVFDDLLILNCNIIFYNILFDENVVCYLVIGSVYVFNI